MGNLIIYYGNSKDIKNIVTKYQEVHKASLYQIKATSDDKGLFNRFQLTFLGKKIAIAKCNLKLNEYDKIIVISELWFNQIPMPVIRFLEQTTGKIKKVLYVLYNNNKKDNPREFDKMDKILNLRRLNSYYVSLNKKEINVRVYQ